ncbi:LysR family transcriptional regulator [Phenylobacterium sp.]|uniref:LysR family transcriptional regulator n=1 Tax=Phenylobacterium sp. TaxID=1871053 RepID=UPI0028A00B47|nr:LysR family transcriptional regulator [Phenylobacterium sp.]
MNDAHFNTLDLNLLRVFLALLEEESATRAGERLGLTQSAVSHALGRLRAALGDELFERGASGLQATPRAVEMGPAIRSALKALEEAVSPAKFDPATTERVFHVAASAYANSVVMPVVVRRLLAEAPGAKLHLVAPTSNLAEDLDRGRLDMVIGAFDYVAERFAYTPLFEDTGVWVIRSGHPALSPEISDEVLAKLPRLLISSAETRDLARERRGVGLQRIASWGEGYALGGVALREIDSPISVPDPYSALVMVGETDVAALLPRRLALLAEQAGRVVVIESDGAAPPFTVGAVVRQGERGAIDWLLALIRQVARTS